MLAPLIFLVLYHYPRIGVLWNIIVILLGIFIGVAPRIFFGIKHFLEFPAWDVFTTQQTVMLYYWRPDSHLVSYAIGMLTGYVIRYKPNLYFGGRVGETILWITCTTSSFASIYWINHFYDVYYPLTTTETLLMMAFSKPLYLLGWVWLFYACSTGRGGISYKHISCKLLIVLLSRFCK